MMPTAKRASDIPEPDTSHFRKWTLGMLYAVEPELEVIAARTMARKRRGFPAKLSAYEYAKKAAWRLVGWYARFLHVATDELDVLLGAELGGDAEYP